ncbi:MAG: class I SAM-dependent methyltransferase [Bergeyella sp.]|nr:class I SAM-dependent methyltransferase [Bergeyella sp.]
MKEISDLIKTFFAYLSRPKFYRELRRKIYKNVFLRESSFKGKEEAAVWCKKMAVSQNQAIRNLTQTQNIQTLENLFPAEMSYAKNAKDMCPVKMGGAGALEIIYYLCEYTRAEFVLETGVAYGWSSLAALLSLKNRNGILYSSDMPYLGKKNDTFVGCVLPQELRKNWKLFRYADKESLPRIFREQNTFQLIHYDSDKSYNGRLWAYPLLWKHLEKQGILISDDIGDNAAFMEFCTTLNLIPTIIGFDDKFAGILVKN